MKDITQKILFRVRWLGMSERSRYAYLWARTKENLQ